MGLCWESLQSWIIIFCIDMSSAGRANFVPQMIVFAILD